MIITRFAPSPTGYLHVGAIRTAIFAYNFAKKHNGKFLLRIEDTDRSRLVPDSIDDFMTAFKTLGINFDDAPVYQSNRLDLYNSYVQLLIDSKYAYYAYDTPEDLNSARLKAESLKLPFRYDGTKWKNGAVGDDKYKVVRFNWDNYSGDKILTDDYLRGTTAWDLSTQDDFVLLKSDGFPTYHLAVVIDDHLMNVTHVFRGEEWLSSAPKQYALYNVFMWDIPTYIHCPNVMGTDKKKLSKRRGAKSVNDYIKDGFLSEALYNFLSLTGHSYDNDEILSRESIIDRFNLDSISLSPAIFDEDKLKWLNKRYILSMSDDDYLNYFTNFCIQKDSLLLALKGNLNKFTDIDTLLDFIDNSDFVFSDKDKKFLNVDYLNYLMLNIDNAIHNDYNLSMKDKSQCLRVALCGKSVGLPLNILVDILGKKECLNRIKYALENSKK